MTPQAKAESLYAEMVGESKLLGRRLTPQEAIACIAKKLGEWEGAKKQKPIGVGAELDDAAWVAMLEGEPHLKGIDIKREINACQWWCKTNKKLPTRRRILNWLGKAERVVDLKASGAQYATGLRPLPPMPPEPKNWRSVFPDFIQADKPWPEIDRTAQIYIADQMTLRQEQA